ncbi:bifunctional RecB family nuclease/DEAD/DEAH box helicase [Cellulomonas sp. URHE0023]|uniref:TM0106 family RecB-like putative nuclease n=1 Tax=Cellulomonas sp. URHE0023 TaxID=1380354 RepID=UPI0004817E7A|nr:bifunctional RecB family nuclease/DEAD/DEAH box helicase [Cellulomonas sp. URHE0023]
MFILDGQTIVYSASDLANAAACEFAVLHALDEKLGRIPLAGRASDAMLERAARLGDKHEARVRADLVAKHGTYDPATGRGVLSIERLGRLTVAGLEAKNAETLDALRSGVDVIFQAGFFDGRFSGWADFLVREGRHAPHPPRYSVHDTKLARHEKPTALLQLAAYADQLIAAGIETSEQVHLILGTNVVTSHRVVDLLPVYRDRRMRLQDLLDAHQESGAAAVWGAPGIRACWRCDVCGPQLEARRDVLLVAGLSTNQRARLAVADIATIDQLAASTGAVDGIGGATLERLRSQAALQVAQEAGDVVQFDLFDPGAVARLPRPDAGDIFFDFEGDPLWTSGHDGADAWGLEYLFGVVEAPPSTDATPAFVPFWAHDCAQEKQALVDFLAYVAERRAKHPNMHVYHYAAYERSALLRLAGRHGVGEDVVDQLLREGVLVDLFATVRRGLRTGQRSYSLKKLEPLYMPEARSGEVTTAGDSIVEYANACAVRDEGDLDQWATLLGQIGAYNETDCVSTLRLRDWLVARAAEKGVAPGDPVDTGDVPATGDEAAPEQDPLVGQLLDFAGEDRADRTDDQQAVAMLAASLGYHWRELKPFWWAHFDRLISDPADWTDPRSTLIADGGGVTVVQDWHVPPGSRAPRRVLRLVGRLEPGSELRTGAKCTLIYDLPAPEGATVPRTSGVRGATMSGSVLSATVEVVGTATRDELLVEEKLKVGADQHQYRPMGLGPDAPPNTDGIAAVLHELGTTVAAGLPALPNHPALDLLRRVPPRTVSGNALPVPEDHDNGTIDAIVAAMRDLDGSYLAVQGPPGTGKTYTGSRAIAALVAGGWKVGVVAQSHAVVENLLTTIAQAGVPKEQIGKKPVGDPDPAKPWTELKPNKFDSFIDTQSGGFVLGGTVWDFTNDKRVPAGLLDVLVVDEAGQFSLANTLALSRAARNLLLLGDPQQLPQVSQGTHPEPVDRSALGWLTEGHDTLPDHLGYFLAHTFRMHPALCAPVSRLSYEGRLVSVDRTADRDLDGIAPGVRCVMVEHEGNAVSSIEEAAVVVEQVRHVVGRRWVDPDGGADRSLEPADVLVVAAYNAQVWTIRRALEDAGLTEVRVGTVDKFQGQQAPVVIVSMAASSPEDVPRGMEFLLNRNRINVAVSRGQWCAIIVRAPGLTDYLPNSPARLEELGAFIGLCDAL